MLGVPSIVGIAGLGPYMSDPHVDSKRREHGDAGWSRPSAACESCGYPRQGLAPESVCPECGCAQPLFSDPRFDREGVATRATWIAVAVLASCAAFLVIAVVPTKGVALVSAVGCWTYSLLPLVVAVFVTRATARGLAIPSGRRCVSAWAALGFAVATIASTFWWYGTYTRPAPGAPGFSTAPIWFVFTPMLSVVTGVVGAAAGTAVGAIVRFRRRSGAW